MPCLVFNSLSSRHRPWAPACTAHILGWQVYAPYPSYCACVWLQPIPWSQVLIFPLLVLCFEVLYSDAQPGLKSKKLGKWLKLQINSFIEWNLSVYIQTPLNAVLILKKYLVIYTKIEAERLFFVCFVFCCFVLQYWGLSLRFQACWTIFFFYHWTLFLAILLVRLSQSIAL